MKRSPHIRKHRFNSREWLEEPPDVATQAFIIAGVKMGNIFARHYENVFLGAIEKASRRRPVNNRTANNRKRKR